MMPWGTMEMLMIFTIVVVPLLGIFILLKLIKAASKAYNKGRLEAEEEHREKQNKRVS